MIPRTGKLYILDTLMYVKVHGPEAIRFRDIPYCSESLEASHLFHQYMFPDVGEHICFIDNHSDKED